MTLDIHALLKGTEFEKQAEMVQRAVNRAGWLTMNDLQNLPVLGLTGVDVYSLLRVLNEQHAAPPAKPKPSRKKKDKELEPENEPDDKEA